MRRSMISQLLLQHPMYFLLLSLSIFLKPHVADADIAKPGCNDTCGSVSIPFPFGIGPGCFHNPWFEIECKTPHKKPMLSKFGVEVMEVKLDTFVIKVGLPPLNACNADAHTITDWRRSPYEISTSDNVLVMKGCPGQAILVNESNAIMAGCATVCDNNNYSNTYAMNDTNNCYGDHCCQASLSYNESPLQFYQIDFSKQMSSSGGQNCLVAALIEGDSMSQYYAGGLSSLNPVLLSWGFNSKLPGDRSVHSYCDGDYDGSVSTRCTCEDGYYGNPYVPHGCQVGPECMECHGYCEGEWDMQGNISPGTYYCGKKPILKLGAILGLSISFGTLVLVVGLYGLYQFMKRRRTMKQRAKCFKRNGGLLLQQQLSSKGGSVERTMVFSFSEISKATNHFDICRILGQGGQGTVYKGMLTDGRIVAIKKAKLLDESQLEQFINEVVILSQINHKNVVKLLGCCLETEVPLLVYEFVSNGTLFQHIHVPDEEFVINWEMRLKIAADSAAAIAYLHSSSSIPIYHRDIKSTNILLDEKHRAKVSDFGSSKTVAIDQTHMTTLVQGTLGYLDPEYFNSYKFTDKSDVYSFGVVLLELLTGKKSIYSDGSSMEQKNLVTEFRSLYQNSRLFDILDPIIVRDAKEDELISVIELAKRCISWRGNLRPTMKEVTMTLEMIISSPAQVFRWYQEQENFPISNEEFDSLDVDSSNMELMSCTLPVGASNTPNADAHSYMTNTI